MLYRKSNRKRRDRPSKSKSKSKKHALSQSLISYPTAPSRSSNTLSRKSLHRSTDSLSSITKTKKGRKIKKIEDAIRAESQKSEKRRQEIRKKLSEVKRDLQLAARARSQKGIAQKSISEKVEKMKGMQRKIMKMNQRQKASIKTSKAVKTATVGQKLIYLKKVAEGIFKEARERLKEVDDGVARQMAQIVDKARSKHHSENLKRGHFAKRFHEQAEKAFLISEIDEMCLMEERLEQFRKDNFEMLRERVKEETMERKQDQLRIEEFILMTDQKIEDFLAIGQLAEF